MKSIYFLLLIFAIAVYVGCNRPVKKNETFDFNQAWTTVTISSENRIFIVINNNDDTSKIKIFDYGSFFKGYHKTKTDSVKAYFTAAEKKSIFYLVKDIIANPLVNVSSCTDFVGELKLTVDYRSFKSSGSCRQTIAYSGVCDWTKLSDKTMRLDSILQNKIKF